MLYGCLCPRSSSPAARRLLVILGIVLILVAVVMVVVVVVVVMVVMVDKYLHSVQLLLIQEFIDSEKVGVSNCCYSLHVVRVDIPPPLLPGGMCACILISVCR